MTFPSLPKLSSVPHTMRGFSLIELLVAVSIFLMISTVVIANHSRFNSSVLLGSLAYDIGLSVREAQVFGLSVRGLGGSGPQAFQVGYGVFFNRTLPHEYILFADTNENNRYDAGVDFIVQTYSLGRGHAITQLCGTPQSGGASNCALQQINIVFERPNPDARIRDQGAGTYSAARIIVSSPGGETREVRVQSTGQISVLNP